MRKEKQRKEGGASKDFGSEWRRIEGGSLRGLPEEKLRGCEIITGRKQLKSPNGDMGWTGSSIFFNISPFQTFGYNTLSLMLSHKQTYMIPVLQAMAAESIIIWYHLAMLHPLYLNVHYISLAKPRPSVRTSRSIPFVVEDRSQIHGCSWRRL